MAFLCAYRIGLCVAAFICILLSNCCTAANLPNLPEPELLSRAVRSPAAASPSSNRLINDPACPEIRSLCNHLPVGREDDLSVLECVQSLQVSEFAL